MGGHAAPPPRHRRHRPRQLPPPAAARQRRHRERVPLPDTKLHGGTAAEPLLRHEGCGQRSAGRKEEAAKSGDGEADSGDDGSPLLAHPIRCV